jgi:hypothetical protein
MVGRSERKRKAPVEELIVVSAVIIAGFALQFFSGPFDKCFLAFPVNVILIALISLVFFMKRGVALSRMASGSLSVILIVSMTIAALWMGLVPGNRVKISWPFVLIYLMLLINLTAVLSLRIKRLSFKDLSFVLNHAGLLILLLASGPGSADKSRYFMTVHEGNTEWRAEISGVKEGALSGVGAREEAVELPLAIELLDFSMEEYPPKIVVINKTTGDAMPLDRPVFKESNVGASFRIENWDVRIDSVIDRPGYAPAAYVKVDNPSTGDEREGWVSCGNYFQTFKLLDLEGDLCVAMTFPEPESYKSIVKVYRRDGEIIQGDVEVNSPMSVGSWKIYQYSYDTRKGRDSEYSVFELVHDPWVIPTYVGYILLLAGAVTLFWKGGKK